MNIILLSGGSGKRLWPLSNEIRSKQFLKLFSNSLGEYESMVQRIYRQIKAVDNEGTITIATSKQQLSSIKNQLSIDYLDISSEPCRRDTFPAIALACAFLKDCKNFSCDDYVIFCPVDSFVEDNYFSTIKQLDELAKTINPAISIIGIKPNCPSSKFGYIVSKSNSNYEEVLEFVEKPSLIDASKLLKRGAMWNAGVFEVKIKYILDKAQELLGFNSYKEIYDNYEKIDPISFDYAVLEKESDIRVLKYDGEWSDLGTWNTLTKYMNEPIIGNVVVDDISKNVNIINELDIPILSIGLNNIVVSASPEGILVAEKNASDNLKKYVSNFNNKVRYLDKSWGCFKIIDMEKKSLTIKISITANDHMNYHSHELRDEIWIVVDGEGYIILDGIKKIVKAGDSISIKRSVKHTVFAITDLTMIEVQIGEDISAEDKIKYPFVWGN